MSQTQIVMASEFLQSVGVELVIFAVTLVLAVTFRGASFGKNSASQKAPKSIPIRYEHGETTGVVRSGASFNPRQHKPAQKVDRSTASTQANGLALKVERMISCANKRQSFDAIAIYEEIKSSVNDSAFFDALTRASQSPVDVFGALAQCAGRASRPELIQLFLNDMTTAGMERPLAFYEAIMKMLASKKCYKEALSVCSRLEADGHEPSPVTLSCLVSFAVEIGEPDRAIHFFQRLAACDTPSIRAYMTVLRLYSRRQDWPKTLALVRDMQERQASIDTLVLNIVLSTGVAAGQLDPAKSLLKEFSHVGIGDVISYNTIMKGFAQQKDGHGAISLLDEMSQAGVKPNAITFNTAMDAAVRSSQVADAWRVLALMCEAGLAPDKFTCTTLMKAFSNGVTARQLSVVLDLLRTVMAECDANLCSSLFRSVLEAAVQVNDPELTTRAVAQMREYRVMLAPQEYQRLLQALLQRDEMSHRSKVCREPAFESMRSVSVY